MNWSISPADENARIMINIPTKTALLQDLEAWLAAGKGFTVATLNLDHVVKLRRDPRFRAAYARHSHVVADGNPIVWISRMAGHDVSLVPGSELVEPVAALAARAGVPVAFVGSHRGGADRPPRAISPPGIPGSTSWRGSRRPWASTPKGRGPTP